MEFAFESQYRPGSLIAISEMQSLQRLKRYFEPGDIVLVVENLWPLGLIFEVKVNPKKKGGLVRKVRMRTNSAVQERPIDNKNILLESTP